MSTAEDVERVRQGWAVAASVPDETSRVFYAHLFRIDPSTKPLFKGDMELQGRKLVDTISFIVDHLEDADALLPAARDLAVRHVSYGVTAGQYASVGAALIAALKQLAGGRVLGRGRGGLGRDLWRAVRNHGVGGLSRVRSYPLG